MKLEYMKISPPAHKLLLSKEIVVIYHGGCDDGYTAAYCAWKKFKDKAFYFAGHHGHKPPYMSGKEIYILDFSYPKAYIEDLQTRNKILLLDHHQTAMEDLKGTCNCHFNLNKSGASMAWEHFHETKCPLFIELVEDGDLWRMSNPDTRAFYHGLRSCERKFEVWDYYFEKPELLIEKGKIIDHFFEEQLKNIIKNSNPIIIDNQKGHIVNANFSFVSDIGNRLAEKDKEHPFAIIWHDNGRQIKCSIRSTKEFDSAFIAQKYGGGGHPQSSSFNLDREEFFPLFKKWTFEYKLHQGLIEKINLLH